MDKRKRSIWSTVITVLVIGGLIYYFTIGGDISEKKHYRVYFNRVEGLTIASQVTINGAVAGKVSDIQLLPPDSVMVVVEIAEDLRVPKGTTASINSAGLSGGQELRLVLGKSKDLVQDGDIITGVNSISLFGENGKVGAALDIARVTLKTADSVINNITDLFGAPAKQDIRFELDKINLESRKASQTAKEVRGSGEEFAKKVEELNKDIADMAAKSRQWPEDIAKVERQTEDMVASTASLNENLQELRSNFKKLGSISDKLSDKNSAVGKLLTDKQQYHTAARSTDTLNRGLNDVMEHPASYWFAIFGKNR